MTPSTTVDAPRPVTRGEIARLLSVILSGRLFINTAYRMAYAFVPEFSKGLGVNLITMGQLIAVRAFAGVLAPVFGALSDRFGRRAIMIGGLLLFIACAVLSFVASSFVPFAIGFVGLGIAKVTFEPSASAYLGDRVPYARRGLVMGLSEMGWASGGLIGVPIAAQAIALWGWQSPFALVAVGGVFALVFLLIALPRTSVAHQGQRIPTRVALAAVSHHRSALLMLGVVGLFAGAGDIISIAYSTWLTQSFALDVQTLGGIVSVLAVADVGGELLSAFAVDRFGKKRAPLTGYALSIAFYLLLPFLGGSLGLAVGGLFLFYICFEFCIVSTFPLLSELVPEARGMMLSLTALTANVGRTLGGLSGAILLATQGFGANGVVAGAVVMVATLIFLVGVKEKQS